MEKEARRIEVKIHPLLEAAYRAEALLDELTSQGLQELQIDWEEASFRDEDFYPLPQHEDPHYKKLLNTACDLAEELLNEHLALGYEGVIDESEDFTITRPQTNNSRSREIFIQFGGYNWLIDRSRGREYYSDWKPEKEKTELRRAFPSPQYLHSLLQSLLDSLFAQE